jgi:hypothetical protein
MLTYHNGVELASPFLVQKKRNSPQKIEALKGFWSNSQS